jgi:C-8 sterol isomerase
VGYVFEPEVLHEIARRHLGPPMEQMLPKLVADLAERYPGHIETDLNWVFNNAGGAMGAMTFLHGSITEYLIVFGTPIGTEGHTGRFFADDYFIILEGEQWSYTPGDLTRSVFRPGEMHHLPGGIARGYRIPEHCWALEYARGLIPSMLPFGFADAVSSTLDWRTVARTLRLYGGSAVRQLARGKV